MQFHNQEAGDLLEQPLIRLRNAQIPVAGQPGRVDLLVGECQFPGLIEAQDVAQESKPGNRQKKTKGRGQPLTELRNGRGLASHLKAIDP